MSHEIYYTSAPEGMKRGSSGFSTVGATEGMAKALWDRLESLSAYRHQFGMAGGGGDPGLNPVSWAHWLLSVSGTTYHVLSRVCDSGVDHTQRTNAFAHHLVLEHSEMAAGGPAWMLLQPGVMTESWDGRVGKISRAGGLPRGEGSAGVCNAWAAQTGDAGWGGVLADAFVKSPAKPVCILFAPGQQLLPLLAETIALLPAAARWNVTFNTYFTSMPTSATCAWRCCLAGTPASQSGLRYAGGGTGGIVIDLTEPSRLGRPAEGPYVTYARTGQMPASLRDGATASVKVASPAKPTTQIPTRTPAATLRPPPTQPIIDDEDSIDVAEGSAEFQGMDIAEGLDTSGEIDVAPVAPSPATQRSLIRKRITPAIPTAEPVFRGSPDDPARAAARRRRQVMMLFGGALLAIAAATILVVISMTTSAPPDLPPTPKPKPEPEAEATSTVAPKLAIPVPRVPVVVTPAPLPENDNTVVVPAPTPVTPKPEVTAPVEVVSRYPAVVTVNQLVEFPSAGRGVSETFGQKLTLPSSGLDPGLGIRKVELHFPESKGDYPGTMTFTDSPAGTLVSSLRPGHPTTAMISWKAGASDPVEIAAIDIGKQHNSVELSWKTGQLVRDPASVTRAYWVLRASTLAVEWKDKKQEVAFAPYEPPPFAMDATGGLLMLPADLPKETTVAPPNAKTLPPGWEATWFTDWDVKDVALRTPANASQVVKFHKATSTQAVESWFIVRFSPGFERVESTYGVRLAAAESDLAQAESDVRAADDGLEKIKKDAGGTLPAGSDNVKNLQGKHEGALVLVDAYKAAVAGYNELTRFDIELTLPNGVRLTTVKFRRAAK